MSKDKEIHIEHRLFQIVCKRCEPPIIGKKLELLDKIEPIDYVIIDNSIFNKQMVEDIKLSIDCHLQRESEGKDFSHYYQEFIVITDSKNKVITYFRI